MGQGPPCRQPFFRLTKDAKATKVAAVTKDTAVTKDNKNEQARDRSFYTRSRAYHFQSDLKLCRPENSRQQPERRRREWISVLSLFLIRSFPSASKSPFWKQGMDF